MFTEENDTQEPQVAEVEAEAKAEAKPKRKASNRMTEEELLEDYPHVIPGTLTFLEAENKQAVKIRCSVEGCEHERTVRTSDLWQVNTCEACTRKQRRERSRERRKAKKEAEAAEATETD